MNHLHVVATPWVAWLFINKCRFPVVVVNQALKALLMLGCQTNLNERAYFSRLKIFSNSTYSYSIFWILQKGLLGHQMGDWRNLRVYFQLSPRLMYFTCKMVVVEYLIHRVVMRMNHSFSLSPSFPCYKKGIVGFFFFFFVMWLRSRWWGHTLDCTGTGTAHWLEESCEVLFSLRWLLNYYSKVPRDLI